MKGKNVIRAKVNRMAAGANCHVKRIAVCFSVGILLVVGGPLTPMVGQAHHCPQVTDEECGGNGYDGDGNYQCEPTDPGWLNDLDGDGDVDCIDPDEDGDLLTDEFEDHYSQYVRSDKDNDNDGVIDVADLVPDAFNDAQVDIIAKKYWSGNCDSGDGPENDADPYIPSQELWVQIGAGGQIDLKIPTGWSESVHVEERPEDSVDDLILNSKNLGEMTDNNLALPEDIFDFPHSSTDEIPYVILFIGLYDHDSITDNRFWLDDENSGRVTFKVELTIDPETPLQTKLGPDDKNCYGKIGFNFEDTLKGLPIDVAVYHRQHPSELIGMGTPL